MNATASIVDAGRDCDARLHVEQQDQQRRGDGLWCRKPEACDEHQRAMHRPAGAQPAACIMRAHIAASGPEVDA